MPSAFPSDHGITAIIEQLDAATDEAQLRTGIVDAKATMATERPLYTIEFAEMWSTVLRHAVATGVRLAGPAEWSWFVSGSVARGEAAPGSDVETMVALGDSMGADDKAEMLSRAADVHALLERCEIAGDANGVLASRPRFCRRVSSWTEGIERWASEPRDDRGVVMAGLVADSLGVSARATVPPDGLRAQVVAAAARNYPLRQAMLQDATSIRATVPSRLRLLVRTADDIDVKLAAMDPVVKIARWAALSAGSGALSTLARLDDAAATDVLDDEDASSLRDCFGWLLKLRWRMRAGAFEDGRPVDDVVSLSAMAPQDRATLRSVAREVTGISRKLAYLASTSTFR